MMERREMEHVINRRMILGAGIYSLAGVVLGAGKMPSKKKGFGISTKNNPDWKDKLRRLNASWFYHWGPESPASIPEGIEFVPMIWGRWKCTREKIDSVRSQNNAALLGFNEPDNETQANISVEDALRLWPILMESGMRLGSPACVHPDGEWMTAFMAEAIKREYRIDFIAIHSYRGNNARAFLKHVEQIHRLYDKPIWITEFAVADWNVGKGNPNRFTPDEVLRFMDRVLPALDRLDFVERYAWFSTESQPALESSRLFNSDGSLTRLGELYASA